MKNEYNHLEEKIDRKFALLGYLILTLIIQTLLGLFWFSKINWHFLKLTTEELEKQSIIEYWDIPVAIYIEGILISLVSILIAGLTRKNKLSTYKEKGVIWALVFYNFIITPIASLFLILLGFMFISLTTAIEILPVLFIMFLIVGLFFGFMFEYTNKK